MDEQDSFRLLSLSPEAMDKAVFWGCVVLLFIAYLIPEVLL